MVATEMDMPSPYLNRLTAPRAVYIDGIWNQEDAEFAANNPQILRFICRRVLYLPKIEAQCIYTRQPLGRISIGTGAV